MAVKTLCIMISRWIYICPNHRIYTDHEPLMHPVDSGVVTMSNCRLILGKNVPFQGVMLIIVGVCSLYKSGSKLCGKSLSLSLNFI